MALVRQPGHTVDTGAEAQEKEVETDVLKHVLESQLAKAPWLKQVSRVCHSYGGRSLKRSTAEGKETRTVKAN